jgi:aspartyl-tRNA(Asn)/glutamyl-tRNA(Gln) amidotransferase subunit A
LRGRGSAQADPRLAQPTRVARTSATDGIFLARPSQVTDGPRLAVKDLFDTAGLATTYGSVLFVDHVPRETAPAVTLLERAGYTNVGKTNLHEFAYGISSQNPHFGIVPNPAAPGRLAGGSSGGSGAALAGGLADVALGTDSGGSIRIPAAWCGVVGFKPTYGLVPIEGCFPLAPSFDHAGPMARDVAGCADAMRALVPDFELVGLEMLGDVSVGVAWLDEADSLVRARVQQAAELFPSMRAVTLPSVETTYRVFMREVADVHRELFAEHADAYGDNVRTKVQRCLDVGDAEYAAGLEDRERVRERFADAVEGLDLLLTPTIPFVAPPAHVDELEIRERGISCTYPFNCVGWPALALPCGPAEDGLPASVQLAARPGADSLVLAVGSLLEASLDRGTAAA